MTMSEIINFEEKMKSRMFDFDLDRMYTGMHTLLHSDFGLKVTDPIDKIMQTIGTQFNELLPGLHYWGVHFYPHSTIDKIRTFRTVPHRKRPAFVQDGFYNPKPAKINLNRCNFPMHQVFYGSQASGVSIEETNMHEDETMLVGEWEVARRVDPVKFYYGAFKKDKGKYYLKCEAEGTPGIGKKDIIWSKPNHNIIWDVNGKPLVVQKI